MFWPKMQWFGAGCFSHYGLLLEIEWSVFVCREQQRAHLIPTTYATVRNSHTHIHKHTHTERENGKKKVKEKERSIEKVFFLLKSKEDNNF